MAGLAQINIRFKADLKEFSTEMQNSIRGIEKFGKQMQAAGKMMSTYMSLPIAAVGGAATKMNLDFDDSMRKVMATSNATSEEFDEMRIAAEKMGAQTRYSASESAEAMNYMALAGWKTQDIIRGLPGVLNLAAASGEDLAMVSDILTDGLTAFGKSADEASGFVDVLAAGASNSNTTIGMLGEAFQYAAPLAGALGYEVGDVTKAIGLMSNAGVKGQKAGTALRSIMTRLVKPTRESQKAMDELGISVVNADGSMKPFNDVLLLLREKFVTLTQAQKGQYAGMLAGQEALSGFLALVGAGQEDFDKLSGAIANSAGTAARMSQQMEGGIGGSWRSLKSAVEGVLIQFGQVMAPAMMKAADAVKEVALYFTELEEGTKKVIVVISALVASVGPLLLGLGTILKLTPLVASGFMAVRTAVIAMNAAMLANPITAILTALTAVVGVTLLADARFTSLTNAVKEFEGVENKATKSISNQVVSFNKLLEVAKNEKGSLEDRSKAIKKLHELGYSKEIDLERINTVKADNATKDYIDTLKKKAIAIASQEKLIDVEKRLIEVQMGVSDSAKPSVWQTIKANVLGVLSPVGDLTDSYMALYTAQNNVAEASSLEKLKENLLANIDPAKALKDVLENTTGIVEDTSKGFKALFEVGSIDWYNAQIDQLEKFRDAHKLTREEFQVFQGQIDEYKKKIEEINSPREKATSLSMNIQPVPEGSITSYERLIAQKKEDLKVTEIGGIEYRALAAEIKDLEFTLKAKVDEDSFESVRGGITRLTQEMELAKEKASEILVQKQEEAKMYADVVSDAFQVLGNNLVASMGESESALAQFGMSMMQMVVKLIAMALANAMANAVVIGTQTAEATGPAAVFTMPAFIGVALAGVMGAFASIPKFADGGVVYGPTLGLMGEYAGAANNPEVIAPLNKLKDLIEPAGKGDTYITLGGGFKISGNELQLILDRNSIRNKRIG